MFESIRSQLDGYNRADLRADVTAGLTTAIMLVPQGMAYAMLAGLDPIVGLYASTIPVAAYALMGTSRQLAVGPVAMVSLMVASGVGALAGGDGVLYASLAATLALMVGVMQWGMGVLRLGFLVKFLSHPVISGFSSAAALIIGMSQLSHILGVKLERSHHVHAIALEAWERAAEINPLAVGISVVSVVALVVLKRWAPRFPRFLVVVAGGALGVAALGLGDQVAIVGEVPGGLPTPALPSLQSAQLVALLPVALTISLVSFMESISVAKKFATLHGYRVDANRELVALGVANVLGSAVQAYPVTGGFSRTAVNEQAGAKTTLAGLVTAGVVVLTLLLLTPLFHDLPKAVLAAIIMTAVVGLVDVEEARHLWQVNRADFGLMALTFVATLTVGIELGIGVGVAASLLWFVVRTSQPHVARLGRLPGTTLYRNVERYPAAEEREGVVALRIDAPLYFANTAFLLDTVLAEVDGSVRHVVLDCEGVGSMDSQALATLRELREELQSMEVELWLAGVRGPVRDTLAAAHLWGVLEDRIVEHVHDAMAAIHPGPVDPARRPVLSLAR